jgi:hypothetical protein
MLKWQDPLSQEMQIALNALAEHLREIKPRGWSVVFSENEVVVRPEDRTIGKFSITAVRKDQFSAAFFSRELNIWNKREYFEVNRAVAVHIKEWMQSEVDDPLKRV